jgi:hypothetical protein
VPKFAGRQVIERKGKGPAGKVAHLARKAGLFLFTNNFKHPMNSNMMSDGVNASRQSAPLPAKQVRELQQSRFRKGGSSKSRHRRDSAA